MNEDEKYRIGSKTCLAVTGKPAMFNFSAFILYRIGQGEEAGEIVLRTWGNSFTLGK